MSGICSGAVVTHFRLYSKKTSRKRDYSNYNILEKEGIRI